MRACVRVRAWLFPRVHVRSRRGRPSRTVVGHSVLPLKLPTMPRMCTYVPDLLEHGGERLVAALVLVPLCLAGLGAVQVVGIGQEDPREAVRARQLRQLLESWIHQPCVCASGPDARGNQLADRCNLPEDHASTEAPQRLVQR